MGPIIWEHGKIRRETMSFTEKAEKKKKLRKMAGRMLWADVKDLMCSWKGILVIGMYLGFFLLPYVKNVGRLNI